jgi:cyclopropane fatty-acyl-phospholipid synthase-like methyltransferase
MTIADEQRRFYEDLYARHGNSPRSLAYRDRETQYERFERLCRLFERERESFTIHEVGCGLGHLGEFLERRYPEAVYSGSDISPKFVEHCRNRFPDREFHLRDVSAGPVDERYDFLATSGLFNPRLQTPPAEWQRFVFTILEAMYRMAIKGLAVNFLTTYHDPDHASADMHYQDPRELSDFVVSRLSRHFSLDAAGPLYEYTLCVYRPEYVRSFYEDAAFARYFRSR